MKICIFSLLLIPAICYAQAVTVEVPPYTSMNVTISSSPAPGDPQSGKCGMTAGLVKSIGLNKESGMSKSQQIKIFGDTKFTRFWVNRVYVAPKDMTPQDMHDVVYEQCMEQGN